MGDQITIFWNDMWENKQNIFYFTSLHKEFILKNFGIFAKIYSQSCQIKKEYIFMDGELEKNIHQNSHSSYCF